MQVATPDTLKATTSVLRPITQIQAAIISFDQTTGENVYQELRTVSGSKEARAYCKSIDATNLETDYITFTAIAYYIVNYQVPEGGEGGFGNVFQYTPNTFEKQIEPLYPPVVWPPVV